MRRVEAVFPDLLPVTHRIGTPSVGLQGVALDPVDMRLCWGLPGRGSQRHEHVVPKRPVRVLVHAAAVRGEKPWLEALLDGGCGLLVVLDEELAPEALPAPRLPGQVVVVAPSLPPEWGGPPLCSLSAYPPQSVPAGVLLALTPVSQATERVRLGLAEAWRVGASFVAAMPVALSRADRHRLFDLLCGEEGNLELENLFFHTDLAAYLEGLEREVSRACIAEGMVEFIPPPATSTSPQAAARASAELLLWARRLDALDGLESPGWQLRRAARALLASGKDPFVLAADDNLRVVPGFGPWVEAFARSLWQGGGEPFDSVRQRWLAA